MAPGSTWQNRTSSLDEKREAIERVVSRPPLQNSEALCQLLRYLADRSLGNPEPHVKEHQIATAVFGRPETFDPRVDSTVRVQTSRLRAKLTEYYAGPGSKDQLQVEIPKGTYSVIFHPLSAPELPAPVPEKPDRWYRHRLLIALALLGSLAVTGTLLGVFLRSDFRKSPSPGASISEFWRAVLGGTEEPLLVFSNAQFVGRPETGLRYMQPGETPSSVFDLYTGIGEVFAVHAVDQVFARMQRRYILKRGRLLNWDDTKNRDLIFVGSPSENLPLRELPINKDFAFGRVTSSPRPGDLGILNLHPKGGEARIYYGSKESPLTDDYAVIQFSPGAVASQRMLLLAGTTTFGTQGAVEFVCREDKVSVLLGRLGAQRPLKPFSALLHVRVQGGVPLDSDLVTLRED